VASVGFGGPGKYLRDGGHEAWCYLAEEGTDAGCGGTEEARSYFEGCPGCYIVAVP